MGFTCAPVQRELNSTDHILLSSGPLPLRVVRNSRARRYLLRLNPDRSVRLTVPRGGSLAEAKAFLNRNQAWLEQATARLALRPRIADQWHLGSELLWRGDRVRIEASTDRLGILFGDQQLVVPNISADLRPSIELHISNVAWAELPPQVVSLANQHGLNVRQVVIRSQRTRWGSCSHRGTISLNWRILHAPGFVRDYLILHELMHLREMNHSRRFWGHVESVCPGYQLAEKWLNQHGYLLHAA